MIDSWFESQIRLADRRGLLTGRHISPVQEYALQLLMLIENKERAEDYRTQFKLALLSHDPERYITNFFSPEMLQAAKVDALTDEEWSLEDTEGTWVFENPLGREDAMRVIEQMLEDTTGEIQASEIKGEWL